MSQNICPNVPINENNMVDVMMARNNLNQTGQSVFAKAGTMGPLTQSDVQHSQRKDVSYINRRDFKIKDGTPNNKRSNTLDTVSRMYAMASPNQMTTNKKSLGLNSTMQDSRGGTYYKEMK